MEITITIKLDEEEVVIPSNATKTRETTKKPKEKTYSQYARVFDNCSPDWETDSEYNRIFLAMCERCANDLLAKRGYILLNEVYDLLGLSRSEMGRHVGWKYDPKNAFIDNRVIFECSDGPDNSIFIDFNVDGQIYPFKKIF